MVFANYTELAINSLPVDSNVDSNLLFLEDNIFHIYESSLFLINKNFTAKPLVNGEIPFLADNISKIYESSLFLMNNNKNFIPPLEKLEQEGFLLHTLKTSTADSHAQHFSTFNYTLGETSFRRRFLQEYKANKNFFFKEGNELSNLMTLLINSNENPSYSNFEDAWKHQIKTVSEFYGIDSRRPRFIINSPFKQINREEKVLDSFALDFYITKHIFPNPLDIGLLQQYTTDLSRIEINKLTEESMRKNLESFYDYLKEGGKVNMYPWLEITDSSTEKFITSQHFILRELLNTYTPEVKTAYINSLVNKIEKYIDIFNYDYTLSYYYNHIVCYLTWYKMNNPDYIGVINTSPGPLLDLIGLFEDEKK
jgi:hypothetical protein